MLLVIAISSCFAQAQNTAGKSDDIGRIALTSFVPDQAENLPPIAKNMLVSKLSQITTQNGVGGNPIDPRFIISAKIDVLTKDITATAPAMIVLTLSVSFYVGDGYEGKSFASYTTTAKGVDVSETKAYIAAIKNIKVNDPAFQTLIDKGKYKIVEYYNTQCDFIIQKAKTLESQNQYDAAIYNLTSVPDVCVDCYNKCLNAVAPIFKKKIEFDCKVKMAEANNVWNAGQDYAAAAAAGNLLSSIDPTASCYESAKSLVAKIGARVKEIDKREWDFRLQKEIGLEKDRIKAYRDIGVAWGNGQPKNITYKSLW